MIGLLMAIFCLPLAHASPMAALSGTINLPYLSVYDQNKHIVLYVYVNGTLKASKDYGKVKGLDFPCQAGMVVLPLKYSISTNYGATKTVEVKACLGDICSDLYDAKKYSGYKYEYIWSYSKGWHNEKVNASIHHFVINY